MPFATNSVESSSLEGMVEVAVTVVEVEDVTVDVEVVGGHMGRLVEVEFVEEVVEVEVDDDGVDEFVDEVVEVVDEVDEVDEVVVDEDVGGSL